MAAGLGARNHDHQKRGLIFCIFQTDCWFVTSVFSRQVSVVSVVLCAKRDPTFLQTSQVEWIRKKTFCTAGLDTVFPQTMMSACSRLTALPAQFARGRTASLTARTAKFTAQVRQHIVHGPLLFFPSPRRGNFPRHARRHRRSQLVVQ
jgi:hypothetical protein